MNDKEYLRLQQIEEAIKHFRALVDTQPPRRGWIRAIQQALGVTNRQLAKRLHLKPQTIEDMQEYEAKETIKLQTLRKLAEALDCRLVYAVVPNTPLEEMRLEQARKVARRHLKPVTHSMSLEAQGVSDADQKIELDRLVQKLLAGNPRKLWE
jgi:predicted DNA-binding mobile mystery protein A